MAGGKSYYTFGAAISVCKDTLYAWEKVHEAFSDAKKIGRLKQQTWWEEKAQEHLVTSGDVKFNNVIFAMTMKNCFGWKDNPGEDSSAAQPVEVTLVRAKK